MNSGADWPTERRSYRGQEDDTDNYFVCIKAIWVVVARASLAFGPLYVQLASSVLHNVNAG